MNTSLFVTYLVAVTVLMLTPGPDMLFCLGSGLKGSSRSGFLAALGAATGEVVHISASAMGLAVVFAAAPALFDAVRIAGASYLVWLGVRSFQHRNADIDHDTEQGRHQRSADCTA
jgi:threonine/homoserine/homoserine lactone efflux protein